MTNAIEQTKREMYDWLAKMKNSISMRLAPNYSIEMFEPALEAHLEELRKALVAGNAVIVECAQHSAESFVELERRLADMKNERDAIQLRLHAVDHAYCESQNTVGRQMSTIASLQDRLAINVRAERESGTSGQVCLDRVASEHTDPYTLGYKSLGKSVNPFPIGSIERLHWRDGANDAMNRLN